MSYRLISSNDIAIKYPEVNDMPCIYADLPNGMDGEHYVLKQEPSGDLISRDELLRAIDTWDKFGVDDTNSLFRLDNLSLPHYVPYIHYDDLVKCIKGMPSGNPVLSGDLISRQAVLNTLDRMDKALDTDRTVESYKELLTECYKVLPPVKQEPKTGHWITQWNMAHQKEYYYCSECREEFSYDGETGIKMNDYNYCPNCGCRMVEPQESEEV